MRRASGTPLGSEAALAALIAAASPGEGASPGMPEPGGMGISKGESALKFARLAGGGPSAGREACTSPAAVSLACWHAVEPAGSSVRLVIPAAACLRAGCCLQASAEQLPEPMNLVVCQLVGHGLAIAKSPPTLMLVLAVPVSWGRHASRDSDSSRGALTGWARP